MYYYKVASVGTQYQPSGSTSREIADHVEASIRDGGIEPGYRLPAIREVADSLGVSPGTVAAAYRRLRERGLVIARGRQGTIVAGRPSDFLALSAPVPAGVRDLRNGNPSADLLPQLAPFLADLEGRSLPSRGVGANDPELLELAGARFAADGIPASSLAVVGGSLDGIERLLMAHTRTGDMVAIEDPAYPPVADLLSAMNLARVPVAIDDHGMLPGPLADALAAGAGAVVITPRAQNPVGAALTAERAEELLGLVRGRPEVLVLEDDHMAEVSGAPSVSIAADPDVPCWAIVRSVSKSLGPDLRVGVVSGDERTIDRLDARQRLGTGWVSTILQRLVAALWGSPRIDELTALAAATYSERRTRMLEALAAQGIEASGASGLNVWVPVEREGLTVERMLASGFAVGPGEAFRLASPPGIRVTISRLGDGEEVEFAAALALATTRTGAELSY